MHIICPKHHYQIKISKKLIIINKKNETFTNRSGKKRLVADLG